MLGLEIALSALDHLFRALRKLLVLGLFGFLDLNVTAAVRYQSFLVILLLNDFLFLRLGSFTLRMRVILVCILHLWVLLHLLIADYFIILPNVCIYLGEKVRIRIENKLTGLRFLFLLHFFLLYGLLCWLALLYILHDDLHLLRLFKLPLFRGAC